MTDAEHKTATSGLTSRIRDLRDRVGERLIERDVAVRLAILAALAGEHLLVIGPPGTAKSLIARRLRLAFSSTSYFERLLTRFTVPEELFGPLSIKGLEADRYERLTTGYLPTAAIAFLDEIFKANSAILNALLTLLNEREFDNGTVRVQTPLVAVVGASNELPEGEELDALYDRFLLRLHVGPVSKERFPELLALRGDPVPAVPSTLALSFEELSDIRKRSLAVEVPDDVVALLRELREWCIAEKVRVSDRRWRKVVHLLQVSALTNGRGRVSVWDCWLLQHCLWDSPETREKLYTWYAARVGAMAALDPSRLTRIVVAWEGRLRADQESRSQARDEKGNLLYRGTSGKPTASKKGKRQAKRGDEPLFLSPADAMENPHYRRDSVKDRTKAGAGYTRDELDALYVSRGDGGYNATQFEHWKDREAYLADRNNWLMEEVDLTPVMEPTRHKPAHVDACLHDIEGLDADVRAYQGRLLQHIASLEEEIRSHLWVTPDFVGPASESLARTRAEVETLLARVGKVRDGLRLLPREEVVDPSTVRPSADVPDFMAAENV